MKSNNINWKRITAAVARSLESPATAMNELEPATTHDTGVLDLARTICACYDWDWRQFEESVREVVHKI